MAAIRIREEVDVAIARIGARDAARAAGLHPVEVEAVATAVSEIAHNIVDHSHGGEIRLAIGRVGAASAVIVVARDHGPGIRDVDQAMRDGFSTTGSLGLGMSSAKRLMDRFSVESVPGRGTIVTMHKWANHS